MTIDEIREINREASSELVKELGYRPDDIVDRGDGLLDFAGPVAVLKVVERDEDGRVRMDGDAVVTNTKHVRVSIKRILEYRKAVRSA